jgi:hypothetical protein
MLKGRLSWFCCIIVVQKLHFKHRFEFLVRSRNKEVTVGPPEVPMPIKVIIIKTSSTTFSFPRVCLVQTSAQSFDLRWGYSKFTIFLSDIFAEDN